MLFVSFSNLCDLFHIISKNNSILSFFIVMVDCQPFNEHEFSSLKNQIHTVGKDFTYLNRSPDAGFTLRTQEIQNEYVVAQNQFCSEEHFIILCESNEGFEVSVVNLMDLQTIAEPQDLNNAIEDDYVINSSDMSYSYGCQLINSMDREILEGSEIRKSLNSYNEMDGDELLTTIEDWESLIAEISRKGSRCCHYALSLLRDAKKNNNRNSFFRADFLYKQSKKKFDLLARNVRRISRTVIKKDDE